MTIIRNRLMSPFFGTRGLFDDLDRVLNGRDMVFTRNAYPAVNVYEEADSWIFTFEVPGIDPNGIELTVKDDVLTVNGKREFYSGSEDVTVHRRESGNGASEFSRSLRLPDQIDAESAAAHTDKGILTVTFSKSETCRERKIEVRPLIAEGEKN